MGRLFGSRDLEVRTAPAARPAEVWAAGELGPGGTGAGRQASSILTARVGAMASAASISAAENLNSAHETVSRTVSEIGGSEERPVPSRELGRVRELPLHRTEPDRHLPDPAKIGHEPPVHPHPPSRRQQAPDPRLPLLIATGRRRAWFKIGSSRPNLVWVRLVWRDWLTGRVDDLAASSKLTRKFLYSKP